MFFVCFIRQNPHACNFCENHFNLVLIFSCDRRYMTGLFGKIKQQFSRTTDPNHDEQHVGKT